MTTLITFRLVTSEETAKWKWVFYAPWGLNFARLFALIRFIDQYCVIYHWSVHSWISEKLANFRRDKQQPKANSRKDLMFIISIFTNDVACHVATINVWSSKKLNLYSCARKRWGWRRASETPKTHPKGGMSSGGRTNMKAVT